MINALKRFGAALSEISETDFLQPGITFHPNRISASLEGISVPIISRSDLLANKRASGRPQDLVDATWLEENND